MILVLVFCAIADPHRCEERRPYVEALSPMACMMTAQQMAAQADDPRWRFWGWRCEPAGKPKRAPA